MANERRLQREEAFRRGQLSLLCCSPTMELGIDIRDLAVVHMRNIPPDPVRYAQRGGRAGRGGQPALVLAFASAHSPHDRHFFRNREQMIAGAVTPPAFELSSRETLRPHLHAAWLAATGIGLGNTMDEVLDRTRDGLPLLPEIAAGTDLPVETRRRVLASFERLAASVLGGGPDAVTREWLERVLAEAPALFDRAFDRWRELYRAALTAREEARLRLDRPRLSRDERRDAEARQREAQRELDLLLNRDDHVFSDFCPYRYLASEGFIPGYNFPRLPVRVFVPTADGTDIVDRPRFLGLAEFGPGNLLYHEGRRYRIAGWIPPAGGLEAGTVRARRCRTCSCIHHGDDLERSLCRWCGARLDGAGAEFWPGLVEQLTSRARRTARISCEEEERAREGYDLQTAFEPSGEDPPHHVRVEDGQGRPLLGLRTLRGARLWRVNRGWRKARERNGFAIDPRTGLWARRETEEASEDDGRQLLRVVPFVRDVRNLALIRTADGQISSEAALLTLAHALRRAIQRLFGLEEQEVAVEVLGEGDGRNILMWEAAKGGLGLVDRLCETETLRQLARKALELLHADPGTGEDRAGAAGGCLAACYDCLLSYANQIEHQLLDRRLVLPLLVRLREARTVHAGTDPEQRRRRFEELLRDTDPASPFERQVLAAIHDAGLPPPDAAQYCPADELPVQVDFWWRRDGAPGVCLFVDGPAHDTREVGGRDRRLREELAHRGYPVVIVRHDRPPETALETLRRLLEG